MGKSVRQLAFVDRFVWLLEQVVSSQWDDCDDFTNRFVFPDLTTRVPLVLYLSQQEWTTLYSAVLTGADLSYPNTSHDVEYLFLQSVICPMNEFCVALINCLLNDPDTAAALQIILAESGLTGGVGDPTAPLSDDVLGGNLLPAGYVCTDDKAFGMALAVVDAMNEATTEVLQAIEVLTNPLELAAELGDNIPGVGVLSSAGDVARWIQNTAKEEYDLAWSTVVRDELACLLWCEFKGDCVLSFDTVWDVYVGAANVAPPSSVLLTDWLAWLILLPFSSALSTVATISLLGLLAMRYGGSFGEFQLGIQSMETVINLAQDETSSDWSIVCDACATTWCYAWSVVSGNFDDWTGYSAGDGRGPRGILDGVGWKHGAHPGRQFLVQIFVAMAPADVTDISVFVDVVPTLTYDARMPGVGGSEYAASVAGGTPSPAIFVLDKNGSGLWIGVQNTGTTEYTGHITTIIIRGTGANPFGADNC